MLDILRKETDAEVHFGHRITGFEQQAASVLVQFESEGIPGKLEAAWLIGADGGRSTVRKLLQRGVRGLHLARAVPGGQHAVRPRRHGFTMNAYVADPVEWAAVFKMPDEGPPGCGASLSHAIRAMPDDALLDPRAVEERMQGF